MATGSLVYLCIAFLTFPKVPLPIVFLDNHWYTKLCSNLIMNSLFSLLNCNGFGIKLWCSKSEKIFPGTIAEYDALLKENVQLLCKNNFIKL